MFDEYQLIIRLWSDARMTMFQTFEPIVFLNTAWNLPNLCQQVASSIVLRANFSPGSSPQFYSFLGFL